MSSSLITYLIIVFYFCIGYFIHNKAMNMVAEDKGISTLYNQLSNGFKIILFLIFLIFWLPIIVGELVIIILNWFAKNYNDMY
jgi:hypothetical protein